MTLTQLDGAVALVTGGASGIGAATSRRIAEAGATVVIADIQHDLGENLAAELGGEFVKLDVGKPAEWRAVLDGVVQRHGRLDVVHLNAGVTTGEGDIRNLTDAQYDRIMGVNVNGIVFGTRAAVPHLESNGGAIVCTASAAGLIAFAPDPIYTLTKHAVVGFVRSIAPQLSPLGITINAICPGIVDTPLLGEEAKTRLEQLGLRIIPPERIGEAVITAALSGQTGEAWVCLPEREPEPYAFAPLPGGLT
jgi:NAD(P)-dependent dehydrogenase (short-subunit alcohol dehydrogenase family)